MRCCASTRGIMHSGLRWAMSWSFCLLVLGCASSSPPDVNATATSAANQVLSTVPIQFSPWTAAGKLSIETGGGVETARFEWHRSAPDRDSITLFGPFALNQQRLERSATELIWQDGDTKKPFTELSHHSAAARLLAALPADTVAKWLLGHNDKVAGWEAEVIKWRALPPWKVPERLSLRTEDMVIQIFVSQWNLDTPQ
jgi:outer membrane biogenesis lipoprotein LolB